MRTFSAGKPSARPRDEGPDLSDLLAPASQEGDEGGAQGTGEEEDEFAHELDEPTASKGARGSKLAKRAPAEPSAPVPVAAKPATKPPAAAPAGKGAAAKKQPAAASADDAGARAPPKRKPNADVAADGAASAARPPPAKRAARAPAAGSADALPAAPSDGDGGGEAERKGKGKEGAGKAKAKTGKRDTAEAAAAGGGGQAAEAAEAVAEAAPPAANPKARGSKKAPSTAAPPAKPAKRPPPAQQQPPKGAVAKAAAAPGHAARAAAGSEAAASVDPLSLSVATTGLDEDCAVLGVLQALAKKGRTKGFKLNDKVACLRGTHQPVLCLLRLRPRRPSRLRPLGPTPLPLPGAACRRMLLTCARSLRAPLRLRPGAPCRSRETCRPQRSRTSSPASTATARSGRCGARSSWPLRCCAPSRSSPPRGPTAASSRARCSRTRRSCSLRCPPARASRSRGAACTSRTWATRTAARWSSSWSRPEVRARPRALKHRRPSARRPAVLARRRCAALAHLQLQQRAAQPTPAPSYAAWARRPTQPAARLPC